MKRTIAQHSERNNKHKADDDAPKGAVPHYLLDREQVRARASAAVLRAWAAGGGSPGISISKFCFSEAPLRGSNAEAKINMIGRYEAFRLGVWGRGGRAWHCDPPPAWRTAVPALN